MSALPSSRFRKKYNLLALPLSMFVLMSAQAAPFPTLVLDADGTVGYLVGPTDINPAISANGSVLVANNYNGSITALRWAVDSNGLISSPTNLGTLSGGSYAYAFGANADGAVIVGASQTMVSVSQRIRAFRWVADSSGNGGTMTSLGTLAGGNDSQAFAVNANGNIVVGQSEVRIAGSITQEAFRWVDNGSGGTMTGLGFLPTGTLSSATAVNAEGNVVAGWSNDASDNRRAFRWTADSSGTTGSMQALALISGATLNFSEAYGMNAAGNIVVGVSGNQDRNYEAFLWKAIDTTSGTTTGLGFLPGGNFSKAYAVNSTGDVVVGISNSNAGNSAVRWAVSQAGVVTAQSVADWLNNAGVSTTNTTFTEATGVDASGKVIVGKGAVSGVDQVFVARVTTPPASAGGSGVIGLVDLQQSVSQFMAIPNQVGRLQNLMLNGAHHRTLMDQAMTHNDTCGWISGDLSRINRQAKGDAGLIEAGLCRNVAPGWRAGIGIGTSRLGLDLANNGHSSVSGQYGIAELDWKLPNRPIVASLLGSWGKWDASLRRGYASTGTQASSGNTNVNAYSLRARIDWQDAFQIGAVNFTPRLAYTATRTTIDAYQETGGSAPAFFNEQKSTAREVRLGIVGRFLLSDRTTLLGHAEIAHRLDKNAATVSGTADALGLPFAFNQKGNPIKRNWGRLGAEVDYKVNERNIINASSFVSSSGEDASVSGAVSWKFLF